MKIIKTVNMGSSNLGWLKSKFHFSFADYYNPDNMNFGVLRVVNDDLVSPGMGFDMHPHKDMEIISYMVDGSLTHQDNMGHKRSINRGMVQYMSAGTGVMHSEHNLGHETARLLQLWIYPDEKDLTPNYGDYDFKWEDRINHLLHMVSPMDGCAPVKIHQDANIYSLFLPEAARYTLEIESGRQGYLIQIEGSSKFLDSHEILTMRDAATLESETLQLEAQTDSHYLLVEMAMA